MDNYQARPDRESQLISLVAQITVALQAMDEAYRAQIAALKQDNAFLYEARERAMDEVRQLERKFWRDKAPNPGQVIIDDPSMKTRAASEQPDTRPWWEAAVYDIPTRPPAGFRLRGGNGHEFTVDDTMPDHEWRRNVYLHGPLTIVAPDAAETALYGPPGARWGTPGQPCPFTGCSLSQGHTGPHIDYAAMEIAARDNGPEPQPLPGLCTCGRPASHLPGCPRFIGGYAPLKGETPDDYGDRDDEQPEVPDTADQHDYDNEIMAEPFTDDRDPDRFEGGPF